VKAISRRLKRLEDRFIPRETEESRRIRELLRQARERAAKYAGQPYQEPPPRSGSHLRAPMPTANASFFIIPKLRKKPIGSLPCAIKRSPSRQQRTSRSSTNCSIRLNTPTAFSLPI
jgi:hypothetical protein